jgi:hypothetical protein
MFAVAVMALAVAMPGVASAQQSDNPLSEVPAEYEPVLDAAAGELGVSADKLQSASREELQQLLCSELEGQSKQDVLARVRAAMKQVPDEQLEGLSQAERQQLEARLPTLITQLQAACDDGPVGDTEQADDASDDESDDDGSVPDRVDSGAGGVTDAGAAAPIIFGGLFAALFGLFGIAIVGPRRRA